MSGIESVLLYGSRARGDEGRHSDVDLLGIVSSDKIVKPFDDNGISFHLYPFSWLMESAENGALFLLHIVNEAVPLSDPKALLDRLKEAFVYKSSYLADKELGCRIIAAVANLPEDRFTGTIRRRYFWGVRPALMAMSADQRSPTFSAESLESRFSLHGLADHIHGRANARPAECRHFGREVFNRAMGQALWNDEHSVAANLDFLMGLGGLATATAGEIIYDIR